MSQYRTVGIVAAIVSVSLSACQTTQIGSPSSKFDGIYAFSYTCDDGAGFSMSSKWDGSSFVVRNGVVSNNKAGAGRFTVSGGSRVDDTGAIYISGSRGNLSGSRPKTFVIQGNLLDQGPKYKITRDGKTATGPMTGSYGGKQMRPCVAAFKSPKKLPAARRDGNADTLSIMSKNTTTVFDLLADKGTQVPVKVVLANTQQLKKNGLAIIVPSSTPDMDDEEYYASKFRKLGLATAVIYGAGPRYTSKFSAKYTSDVIVRDVAETISVLSDELGKPKKIYVMGSSTGSLGVFKLAWTDLRAKYPQLKQVTAGFMVNAACPDSYLGNWDNGTPIYALNGVDDDSTPASTCKTIAASGMVPGFKSLTYPGAHHFESPVYGPTEMVDGMHILPTCSINYSRELHTQVKRRDGSDVWDTREKGFGKALYTWLGKTCVKRGNLQGYDKRGSDLMWGDVNKIVVFGGL